MTRILVVEDAHSLRKDIVEMLQFEGYEVDSAENGALGLEIARTRLPDLIISDIMMPVMDGIHLLQALRTDGMTASIPLIFLTARTDRMDMRQGMEQGADDFVTKPFHSDELLATVRAQIHKHALRTRAVERRLEDLRSNIILALPHELRTPLNAVLGFSELLMSDSTVMPPERVRSMAERIHGAGKRLFALVENYLLYAHLELLLTDPHRLMEARHETALFPHLTIHASAEGIALAHHRQAGLEVQLEPIKVLGISEVSLKKLFDELIDNAFKFSSADSTVTLHGQVQPGGYRVTLTDRGVGMTAQQMSDIGAYMQFSRRLQEQQGAGLGLVIARRLCDVYHIGLTLESVVEQGTTLTLDLRAPASPG